MALLLGALVVGPAVAAAIDPQQFDLAAGTIRCDCGCHPQSVKECACGRAAEMRDEIRTLLGSGMTGEQVIAKYVAEKGEQIRLSPTATGFNLVAWLAPLAGLLGAGAALLLVLRRWRGKPPSDRAADAPPPAAPGAADREYRERLREALQRMQ